MALCSNGATTTETTASLPSLPMELVEEEILCRLPVKILMQLRCICKSWKFIISDDPKFAKKHLRMSKILKQQVIAKVFSRGDDLFSLDSPLSDVLSNIYNPTTVTQTQLNIPNPISHISQQDISRISSCDGILFLTFGARRSAVVFNPSLRKYSILPPILEKHHKREQAKYSLFSFGYDHVNDVYKVIAISCFDTKFKQVDVYTLGTNYWRSIQDFPYCTRPSSMYQIWGVFVGGAVNWLASEVSNSSSYCRVRVIASLDLEKESYQTIPQPDLENDHYRALLAMFRDCLCFFAISNDMFLDVWIMKEYGIKESWTKLYNVPCVGNQCTMTGYIPHDDQLLLSLYDSIRKTLII